MLSDELARLGKLRADGVLSDDEFNTAKSAVINGAATPAIELVHAHVVPDVSAQPMAGALSIDVQPMASGAGEEADAPPITRPSDVEMVETPTGVVIERKRAKPSIPPSNLVVGSVMGCVFSWVCCLAPVIVLIVLSSVMMPSIVVYMWVIFILMCCFFPLWIVPVVFCVLVPVSIGRAVVIEKNKNNPLVAIELNTKTDELMSLTRGANKVQVIKASNVVQFYVDEKIMASSFKYSVSSGGKASTVRKYRPMRQYTTTKVNYKLFALLKDGTSIAFVTPCTFGYGKWLERELEERLGIADERVEGEATVSRPAKTTTDDGVFVNGVQVSTDKHALGMMPIFT